MIYALIHTVHYEGSDVLGVFTTLPRARAAKASVLADTSHSYESSYESVWIERHEPDALNAPAWDRPSFYVNDGDTA